MDTIGYITLSKNQDTEFLEKVQTLTYKVQELHSLETSSWPTLAGLIIEESSEAMNAICELLVTLKRNVEFPIWIVSTSSHLNKTIRMIYLQLGVNGILDHQLDVEERLLMVRNSVERQQRLVQAKGNRKTQAQSSSFQLIPQNLSVHLDNGEEVDLTRLEFQIMELLFRHAKKTVTYEEIYEQVWKDKVSDGKYRVCNLIFHLRKKIELDEKSPRYIKTVRSKGYMLNV